MPVHGLGGAFGGLVSPEVWNAVAAPDVGLLGRLPRVRSVEDMPQITFLTGFDSTAGTRPQAVCGTCQVVGAEKSCVITAPFGRMCYTSDSITIENTIRRMNAGEPDFQLIGSLVSEETWRVLEQSPPTADILQAGLALGMLHVVRAIMQSAASELWEGNPASGTGAYVEPRGLEWWLTSDHEDAFTGDPCPDLNALAVDYDRAFDDVAGGAFTIIETLRRVMAYLEDKARKLGLAPATWAIVTDTEGSFQLANLWSRAYITSGISSMPTGSSLFVDASGSTAMRDRMLGESSIVINGKNYTFIGDSGVPVTLTGTPPTTMTSSIYVIPLTAAGRPATYINYLDFSRYTDPKASWMNTVYTDQGLLMWYTTNTGPCYQVTGVMRWRPITLPPLAAIVKNVEYPAPPYSFVSGVPGTPGYSPGSGVPSRQP